jgi:hypothetical protein
MIPKLQNDQKVVFKKEVYQKNIEEFPKEIKVVEN